MDSLSQIIQTLATDDQKEFRAFIKRQQSRRERKDLELFNLLCAQPGVSTEEILLVLYPAKPNRNAYHALRKRLMAHLMDFVVLKQLEADTTAASSLMGMLSLSRYLFAHQAEQLAWKYLLKAEKVAVENEQFELLNSIYNLQMEQSMSATAPALESIIDKRYTNKALTDEEERANMAYSIIKQRLRTYRLEGGEMDFDALVIDVLERFQLTDAIARRPKILYRIMSIIRSGIIAKKEFYGFEPFVIGQYQALEASHGFTKSSHVYKLNLLYMIAHVLYRNRRFERAAIYLQMLNENLHAFGGLHRADFEPRYVMLLAACQVYAGENADAVALVEALLADETVKLTLLQELNCRVNLAVYYFNQDGFKAANRLLLDFGHSDQWYGKKLGREWVLKKNLIELIVQYELGNDDLTENRIRSMERNFRDLFHHPVYQRVQPFLKFIRQMINKPDFVETELYEKQVRATLVNVPREQEDLQAMAFYAWLKSKMLRQPYYEVLLDVVNE